MQILAQQTLTFCIALYGLPLVIGTFVALYSQRTNHRRIWITCLLFGSLATMMSLNIQQLLAPYKTSTEYGATGKKEIIESVRRHVRAGDYIFATPQFIYELRDQNIHSGGWRVFESPERFYELITLQKPSVIIAGLGVNTYEQLKWLLSEDNQSYLGHGYILERIGTYFLWLKKASGQQQRGLQ